MMSRERRQVVADARAFCMYVVRKRYGLSYPDIGEMFDRDHSTVLLAVRNVEWAVKESAELRELAEQLIESEPFPKPKLHAVGEE